MNPYWWKYEPNVHRPAVAELIISINNCVGNEKRFIRYASHNQLANRSYRLILICLLFCPAANETWWLVWWHCLCLQCPHRRLFGHFKVKPFCQSVWIKSWNKQIYRASFPSFRGGCEKLRRSYRTNSWPWTWTLAQTHWQRGVSKHRLHTVGRHKSFCQNNKTAYVRPICDHRNRRRCIYAVRTALMVIAMAKRQRKKAR